MLHPFYPWEFPDQTFPFSVNDVHVQHDLPMHQHRFLEIVFITAGHGMHSLNGNLSTIEAGDCFVIPIDSAHAYSQVQHLHLVNILFHEQLLAPFHQELNALPGYHALFTLEPAYHKLNDTLGRLRTMPTERLAIMEVIEQMRDEAAEQAPGYRLKLIALFFQLLVNLSRVYQNSTCKPSARLIHIGAVISKMEQDYTQPLTIKELADVAYMSERNLTRRFREGVGMPPHEYLIRLRMRHAAQLLRGTTRPIAEISQAVGIDDGNYFSRQFKRVMGISPRNYRNIGSKKSL